MVSISNKARVLPASAIRKLVPFAEDAKARGVKVFHLNIGQPDISSPVSAIEAVKALSPDHVSYTHSAGLIELRKALVEKYYPKFGIDIPTEGIIITTAGSEALDFAMQIACDDGDEIIIPEPFYTNYASFAKRNKVTVKPVHTDITEGFKIPPVERIEAAVGPATKAILICNPGNPTGTVYSREEILSIGKICVEKGLFLISDEVYREFCYTSEPYFSAARIPGAEQNVILVDSVSKRYNLCGCRIGCIVSKNPEVMAAALKYAQARLSPPYYGQIAALGAIDAPDSYFEAVKKEYIARRDCLVKGLNALDGVYTPTPDGAFYTIASLPVDDAERFALWLLQDFRYDNSTVQITPAASFYATKGEGINQARIAYVLEVSEIEKAVKVIGKALEAYPGRV